MAPEIYIKSMKNKGCVADAFLERFGAALGCQMLDFGSQNLQHITKMATKIDPKSMKNRGCVADAFLERFRVVPDAILGAGADLDLAILATIFDKKSKK